MNRGQRPKPCCRPLTGDGLERLSGRNLICRNTPSHIMSPTRNHPGPSAEVSLGVRGHIPIPQRAHAPPRGSPPTTINALDIPQSAQVSKARTPVCRIRPMPTQRFAVSRGLPPLRWPPALGNGRILKCAAGRGQPDRGSAPTRRGRSAPWRAARPRARRARPRSARSRSPRTGRRSFARAAAAPPRSASGFGPLRRAGARRQDQTCIQAAAS
jgi:hypothetical protein